MDVLEFKALEDKIAKLQADKADLISKQKQVVVYHKHFNGTVVINRSAKAGQPFSVSGVARKFDYDRAFNGGIFNEYQTHDIDLADAVRRGWLEIDIKEDSTKTTKDYENLSEIVKDIREEELAKVEIELSKAQLRASIAEQYTTTVEDKCTKQIISIREAHKDLVDGINKDHQEHVAKLTKNAETATSYMGEQLKTLSQEFEDFKADKKRLTLEQQLAEAIKTIAELKAKKWYKF